jgi:recombination protein RecR
VAGSRSSYPEAVDRLIGRLAELPGIGRRSAERLAFHLLTADPAVATRLSEAVADLRRTVSHCSVCMNLTDTGKDPCAICADDRRDRATVLVVEQPRDLIALEQTGMYTGLYHVLMGRLSPLDGVGPGDLTIANLLDRLDHPDRNPGGTAISEVVLGLNPTLEGDGTSLYLAQELKGRSVRVSRLARGLPSGSELEYANRAALADALHGRQPLA